LVSWPLLLAMYWRCKQYGTLNGNKNRRLRYKFKFRSRVPLKRHFRVFFKTWHSSKIRSLYKSVFCIRMDKSKAVKCLEIPLIQFLHSCCFTCRYHQNICASIFKCPRDMLTFCTRTTQSPHSSINRRQFLIWRNFPSLQNGPHHQIFRRLEFPISSSLPINLSY